MTGLHIVPVGLDHPDARAMCQAVQDLYRLIYGGSGDTSVMDDAHFVPPHGQFLVGYLDGRPAASGGWRLITEDRARFERPTAEVKRLYVDPAFRRRGLATELLFALEDEAAAHGVERLVLETGPRQPEAIALYRALGYTDTDGRGWAEYVDYRGTVVLGRDLTPRRHQD